MRISESRSAAFARRGGIASSSASASCRMTVNVVEAVRAGERLVGVETVRDRIAVLPIPRARRGRSTPVVGQKAPRCRRVLLAAGCKTGTIRRRSVADAWGSARW